MEVLIDSCVLINCFKNNENSKYKNGFVNSIIEIELLQGAKNKRELQKIKNFLSQFYRVEINQNILDLSKELILRYSLSHSLKLADAIIASTALIYDLELITYNIKDFKYIEDIKLYKDNI